MTYTRKFMLIIQFSISLMLIFISIILFNDVNLQISPYKNYMNLNDGWMLKANVETVEKSISIDMNPEEYHKNIIPKIEKIYSKYNGNMIVYYPNSIYHDEIGKILFLNDTAFVLNHVEINIFEPYLESKAIPIILNSDFYGSYVEGDVIEASDIDYIVAKVLNPNEEIKVLGPVGFTEDTSNIYSFALFDNRFIAKELRIGNINFLHSIFFHDLDYKTIKEINEYINEPNLNYNIESINEIQKEYYLQKMIGISSYFLVGLISFLFSIIGFVCAIYVDIYSNEVKFSVMRIVGYTNMDITFKYLVGILFIIFLSYIYGLILANVFLGFSFSVSVVVLLIVLSVSLLISVISHRLIISINCTEVVGGINV